MADKGKKGTFVILVLFPAVFLLIVGLADVFLSAGSVNKVYAEETGEAAGETAEVVHQSEATGQEGVVQDNAERLTKYFCNGMIALITAMLLNYAAVLFTSRLRRTTDSELLEHTMSYYENTEPESKFASSAETSA